MKVSTLVAFLAAAAIVHVLAAPNTPSASPSSTRPSNESRPFTTNIDDDIVQSRVLRFNREELAVLFAQYDTTEHRDNNSSFTEVPVTTELRK